MRLTTSITDVAAAPEPSARRATLARYDRPVFAAMFAFAGWLVFAVARLTGWADGKMSLFLGAGTTYSHAAQMIPAVAHVKGSGYDGQFFYRFAIDPVNWHPTAYGITIDRPYRYTRIGYPVVAWAASLGGHAAVLPFVLVGVNLLSVAGMAWLGGLLARSSGRHALWGLLFAAYFGLVVSVGRDTSEPLADLSLIGGLLSYRHRRFVLAALLTTYAVLTNEPVLVFPLALALTRLRQVWRKSAREGLPDLMWMLPGFGYVLLQGIQYVVLHGATSVVADTSANLTWPFTALIAGLYRDVKGMSWTRLAPYDYNLIEFLVLATLFVAAFRVLRSTAAPPHERVAFIGFVTLELIIASSQFWYSTFGDGRTFIDAYVMALVLLLSTPVAPNRAIANRNLHWLAAMAATALVIAARRRILYE